MGNDTVDLSPPSFTAHEEWDLDSFSGHERLEKESDRLFSEEADAALGFLELSYGGHAFWSSCIRSLGALESLFRSSSSVQSLDPKCRYLFVHSRREDSREKLAVTHKMLIKCFSRLRVMPDFVDFLFPFGFQVDAWDRRFSQFRQRTIKPLEESSISIPDFGWSGTEIQICYNLKSAEAAIPNPNSWSIRQCAVYHSFDLDNGRTNWVFVKGNSLLSRRIEKATRAKGLLSMSNFKDRGRAFAATLATHILICEWSSEEWRWYLRDLENDFEQLSGRSLSAPVHILTKSEIEQDEWLAMPLDKRERKEGFSNSTSLRARILRKDTTQVDGKRDFDEFTYANAGLSQPVPPHVAHGLKAARSARTDSGLSTISHEFSIPQIQKIQYIQEQVREANLTLKQNLHIIRQLEHFYLRHEQNLKTSESWRSTLPSSTRDFERFFESLGCVKSDLQIHIERTETLVTILADRRSFLQCILDWHTKEINRFSNDNVARMTEDMNDVARKTKIEAVSMKVITIVTLCFLPATFISTLMSTDIFPQQNPSSRSSGAYSKLSPVSLYLAIVIPLTALVLTTWYILHRWEQRRENNVKAQRLARPDLSGLVV